MEIWMFFFVIYLDVVLIVFELYHSLNILFAVYLVNNIMKCYTAYDVHTRTLKALRWNGLDNQ